MRAPLPFDREDQASVTWVRLDSARAEQAWIDGHIGAGIARPQIAVVQYQTPAIIFRRRDADDSAARVRAAQVGYDFLQRGSGGGVVLAGPWLLGVDILLPAAHPLSMAGHVAGFRWLGETWRNTLARLGMIAEIANAASIAEHDAAAREANLDWACFAGLSHGELLDGEGRKLLGLSQRRGRWGILASAGLLLSETPWEALEFVRHGQRPQKSGMRERASPGLASLAPALTVEELCRCLLSHLQRDVLATSLNSVAGGHRCDREHLYAESP